MASSINALTTGSGGVITTADNSGDLNIQSGGSTKIAVTSAGVTVTGLAKASLPTGSVLQVVNATFTTNASTTSSSYVTTGFAASITPTSSSSKILVVINLPCYSNGSNIQNTITIYRGGTDISINGGGQRGFGQTYSSSGALQTSISAAYLDSPATTSSTTYTIYQSSTNTAGVVGICQNNVTATMTLMEIAA
jgi:hypothetical protein